jgi:mRNA-degrading endonuclease RelE of RelBE toxin-antitoxin system
MAEPRIPFKVVKEVRRSGMPAEDWESLKERLRRIASDPLRRHPDVKPFENGFRVRHGDWRAIYVVNEKGEVEVVRVGHRREVYRR